MKLWLVPCRPVCIVGYEFVVYWTLGGFASSAELPMSSGDSRGIGSRCRATLQTEVRKIMGKRHSLAKCAAIGVIMKCHNILGSGDGMDSFNSIGE